MITVIAIVGNKADRAKYRQIEATQGETYAKSVGAKFYEVSAKTGEGKCILVNDILIKKNKANFIIRYNRH